MNKALLYRPGSKWNAVAAFAVAATLHLSAVAFGSFHREALAPPEEDPPVIGDNQTPPELTPPLPEIDLTPESVPAQLEQEFVEASPPPRRLVKEHRLAPIRPAATNVVSYGRGKSDTVSAPRPDYPYEARRRHLAGSGVVVVAVDSVTGSVIEARIGQSMGDPILDNSALSAFRRWRFKPGSASRIQIPVTFDLRGVSD